MIVRINTGHIHGLNVHQGYFMDPSSHCVVILVVGYGCKRFVMPAT